MVPSSSFITPLTVTDIVTVLFWNCLGYTNGDWIVLTWLQAYTDHFCRPTHPAGPMEQLWQHLWTLPELYHVLGSWWSLEKLQEQASDGELSPFSPAQDICFFQGRQNWTWFFSILAGATWWVHRVPLHTPSWGVGWAETFRNVPRVWL